MPTDEMLTARTLRGDVSAFEELINRYKNSVFNIIYRMTGQYQEAEDVCQEVFITVYQKLHQYDSSKRFGPWVHRIAINTTISALRKKNKVITLNFDETYSQPESENHYDFGDPQLFLERNELKAEIKQAFTSLPEAYPVVLALRYQLDLDNQEIAEALGITKENVEVKMHRARKSMRRAILKNRDEGGKVDGLSGTK
ncbi:MAG: sigma-70 family RNA polymerase sigma factor [Syntrophomonas sp.]|nr:sigma-70 family RNA polymerase sigma factor [Syntrophomonas sp.]